MRELALHILDIVQNAWGAGASLVQVDLTEDLLEDQLVLRVSDNGCGMEPSVLASARDPFFSTRDKPTGLGIPLLCQAAEQTGGALHLSSHPGEGTVLEAIFQHSHLDRVPLGNLADAVVSLVVEQADLCFFHRVRSAAGEKVIVDFDTRRLRPVLDGVSLVHPEVLQWIRQELNSDYEQHIRSDYT